jgi:hypothetical protein
MKLYYTNQKGGITMSDSHTVTIHFHALSGPSVICTLTSATDTYTESQRYARDAFIHAFNPSTLILDERADDKQHGEIQIHVTTWDGYDESYQCHFATEYDHPSTVQSHYEFIVITTREGWSRLTYREKIDTWAAQLQTRLRDIISLHAIDRLCRH